MMTHRKNVLAWCISRYHVIGLKQSHCIEDITLKEAKKSWCRSILDREVMQMLYVVKQVQCLSWTSLCETLGGNEMLFK